MAIGNLIFMNIWFYSISMEELRRLLHSINANSRQHKIRSHYYAGYWLLGNILIRCDLLKILLRSSIPFLKSLMDAEKETERREKKAPNVFDELGLYQIREKSILWAIIQLYETVFSFFSHFFLSLALYVYAVDRLNEQTEQSAFRKPVNKQWSIMKNLWIVFRTCGQTR